MGTKSPAGLVANEETIVRPLTVKCPLVLGLSLNKAEWLKYWILKHRNGAKSAFLPIKG
jgi:hypothetical protein